jgi:hypothetical protein
MRVSTLAAGLVFAALSAAAEARAQPATTPVTTTATATALPLQLELGNSKLDPEAVRKAVELELKRPVVLTATPAEAPSLIVIAHPNRTVTVSYQTSAGATRSRSISIPEDTARGAEVIALLSGNLSRDEAAELLADLAAKPAPSAEEAAAPSAPDTVEKEPAAKPDVPPPPAAAETRPPASPERAQPSSPPPLIQTPPPAINLSLIPSITLYRQPEQRLFAVELGLTHSRVGGLRGVGVAVLVLRVERDMRGASFATFYNDTGGTVAGLTGSGLVNRRLRLRGWEVSGLMNLGGADGRGVAATGLANLGQGFEGLQAAGLLNWAKEFQGVQAAGILNRAQAVTGLQVAGVVNVADSISGLQLGAVNVAGDVHGLQVGIVNVAKHVSGTSIGLISVADNGRVHAVAWTSSAMLLNAAAKFTVGPLYTQAGFGYAPTDQIYCYELGLGGHFPIGRLFIEPGVHYSEMRGANQPFDHELLEYGHYRIAAGLDLGRVAPFAGIGVLQRFAHSADAPSSVPVTVEVFGGAALF